MLEDLIERIIERITYIIAEAMVELAIEYLESAPVNAGQESICFSHVGDFADQVEAIAYGEFEGVEPSHPEAVGLIFDVCNEICYGASELCADLRNASFLDLIRM